MKANSKPIQLDTDMVNAVLEGRKTQFRTACVSNGEVQFSDPYLAIVDGNQKVRFTSRENTGHEYCYFDSPYGKVGDCIWVQEEHLLDPVIDGTWNNFLFDDGSGRQTVSAIPTRFRNSEHVIYKATARASSNVNWRSPKSMPKWACRIALRITNVRIERLHEIRKQYPDKIGNIDLGVSLLKDIHAEGIVKQRSQLQEISAFVDLWNSKNDKSGYRWKDSPWVWAYEFSCELQDG